MERKNQKNELPEDPQILKGIIHDLENALHHKSEQLKALQQMFFGSKSEKLTPEDRLQMSLFDEAESEKEGPEPDIPEQISYTRQKSRGGRKPFSPNIPREEIIIDIDESEKQCACGHELVKISEEVSEQLDVIPARIRVIRTIRPRYACKNCEGSGDEDKPGIRMANIPPRILPQSMAAEGLLAHIVAGKFCDSLPLYRQEKIFKRMGAEVSRKNMANWMISLSTILEGVRKAFGEHLLGGPLINADETTLQVMGEKDRPNQSKSYMWVFKGGPPGKPVVIFQYERTRSSQVAREAFENYHGAVQTDGYSGYKFLKTQKGVLHLGCWAHARRMFIKADKASPKGNAVKQAISFISKIYREENILRRSLNCEEITQGEFLERRKVIISPILEKFKIYLEKKTLFLLPSGLFGEAVSYTLNQWNILENFLDIAEATPDNNAVENAIRPFVVGRKNWLFSGSPRGASASAFLYSLVETAKANSLEPYFYLRYLFTHFPTCPQEQQKSLLPWNL
ncbi:MAG: IS66 family transposase, partial [Spirochaetaceae bacterium]|nr:IS66 family transposase [Spirochaetaceae bacterium]